MYRVLSKELAKRLYNKGLYNKDTINYALMDEYEKKATRIIRAESTYDKDHLKGDYVIESDLRILTQIEKVKEKYKPRPNPPVKKMQLTDNQLKKIFELTAQGLSMRKIASQMAIDYRTVSKVLHSNYNNDEDIEKIEEMKKLIEKFKSEEVDNF